MSKARSGVWIHGICVVATSEIKFRCKIYRSSILETLYHGVYWALVNDKDGIPHITESRSVTFYESKFPGAPNLVDFMDDESDSDDIFEAQST